MGRNGPAHWVTESPALPDLILGHEVHALGRSRADRFLGHGAWGLGRPPARSGLWLSVSSLLGDRLLSNAGRGGGAGAALGEIGAAGLSFPGVRAPTDNLGPQSRSLRASLPTCFVRGCHSPPPLRKTVGKPQDLTRPPPFRPVKQVYLPGVPSLSVPSLMDSVIETPVTTAWITK